MATTAKATGYLELNIAGFDQALKTAKNLLATFAAGFTAYKIEKFFEDGIKGAIDFGKEMQSASRAMGGFDPGALFLTQKALEKTGMGAEEARGHIGDFIREGKKVSMLFGGFENYAEALKSASRDYGSQASVLTRSAEKLQSVWNTLESVGSKVKEFFLSMTEKFVEPLQTALDYLNEIHLDKVGADFGDAIGKAATMLMGIFKNGNIMDVFRTGLVAAFYGGIDVLMVGFQKAVAFLSKSMEILGNAFRESMKASGLGDFFKSLFNGIAMNFASVIDRSMAKLPGLGHLGSLADSEKTAAEQAFQLAGAQLTHLDFGKIDFKIPEAIKAGKEESGKIEFGESDYGKRAKEEWKKLQSVLEQGTKTGEAMNAAARSLHAGDEKNAKNVLTSFSAIPARSIADNLQKIGGGGNYLKVGMSVAEKTYMEQKRARVAQEESKNALNRIDKKMPNSNQSPTLGRGR